MKFLIFFVIIFSMSIPLFAHALSDIDYKDHSYSLKASYYEVLNEVKSTIKSSENALSGFELESSEAKKQIDNAWDFRWDALKNHDQANDRLNQLENSLKSESYQYAYKKFYDIEQSLIYGKNSLVSIIIEMKDANELEKNIKNKIHLVFYFGVM